MDQLPHDSLPLARMASIKQPFFWIYLGMAIMIYAVEKFLTHTQPGWYYNQEQLIIGCVFIALFLNLISQGVRNKRAIMVIRVITYSFEAITLILFIINLCLHLSIRA
jgi:hypothetical protein